MAYVGQKLRTGRQGPAKIGAGLEEIRHLLVQLPVDRLELVKSCFSLLLQPHQLRFGQDGLEEKRDAERGKDEEGNDEKCPGKIEGLFPPPEALAFNRLHLRQLARDLPVNLQPLMRSLESCGFPRPLMVTNPNQLLLPLKLLLDEVTQADAFGLLQRAAGQQGA